MRLGRTLRLGVAVCAAFLQLAGMARAADLTVGANVGNVPWEFQDETGKIVGFEVELVSRIAANLGKTVEFVNIPFNGLFPAVQSGRINAAISSITITPARLRSLSFTQPYYDSDQALAVSARGGVAGLSTLAGKMVGVDTASTGDQWATANQARYRISDIRRYEGLAPAMLDLQAGRIDGYVSDIPAVQYYIRDKPQFRVAERIPTGERYGVMLAKDSPLAAQFDAEITKLKQEGFLAALHQRWFGAAPAADSSTTTVLPMPTP